MTERAKRIYRLACAGCSVALLGLVLVAYHAEWRLSLPFCLAYVAFVQSLPLFLVAANLCLLPGETKRQARFLSEAKSILASVRPYVVGITGSYGKTSTKMILGEMMSAVYPTFWPAKSINTPMGITRAIREGMKPQHRYAVIEMGAYQRGSIKRLCDLTPPQAGIVTAVGIMHLERFLAAENVFLAKSELAQAIPQDGILVCNGDDELARRMATEQRKKRTLLYGFDREKHHLDCWMTDIVTSASGTSFVIHWDGKLFKGSTRLHGRPMLGNILAAFTMACALGNDPSLMTAVIQSLEPVKNRLEVKRENSVIYVHDAYNSNPVGFAAALNVLAELPGSRKVLVTPGMVELGQRQESENVDIAQRAASICDLVIVVGRTNLEPLLKGLAKGAFNEANIRTFVDRDAAFDFLRREQREGDVVLIENDLPDLYEVTPRF